MSPRTDQVADGESDPELAEWLADDLETLVRSSEFGQRNLFTLLGYRLGAEWQPGDGRLVVWTDPEPESWVGREQPPQREGLRVWGNDTSIAAPFIARPPWSRGVRDMFHGKLKRLGWVPDSNRYTATWGLTPSSAADDAHEAADLMMHVLTSLYFVEAMPFMVEVYEVPAQP